MNTPQTPFRFKPEDWLLADRFMLREASKPFDSRRTIVEVCNYIRAHCFNSAPRKLAYNAIKKRYQTYWLGDLAVEGEGPSIVEQADTEMELEPATLFPRTPSQLAKGIKEIYFKNSQSSLHTIVAIEKRYRKLFLWAVADYHMQWAAQAKEFTIDSVVGVVKEALFSNDESITRDDIQHRYCERWLIIDPTAAVVTNYNGQLFQTACLVNGSNHSNDAMSYAPVPGAFVGMQSEATARQTNKSQHSSTRQQHTVVRNANQRPRNMLDRPLAPSSPSVPESRNTRKHARSDSTDSDYLNYRHGINSYGLPKPSSVAKEEKQMRDSGLSSNMGSEYRSLLISRVNRGSRGFAPCPNHPFMNLESPCQICHLPELSPKPHVDVPPDFGQPQCAEDVVADDMNDGRMWMNDHAWT